jgi:hypothetical protein
MWILKICYGKALKKTGTACFSATNRFVSSRTRHHQNG